MPMTILQEKARKKYVTVKQFGEQYSLSKAHAYRLLSRPEFKEAVIKIGDAGIRVDLDKAFEIMQMLFN
jgi:hypothetical protein